MDEKRSEELIPQIREIIKNYDTIIYFKAGARGLYEKCLANACKDVGVKLISFGFGFMGGINDLPSKIKTAEEDASK